MGEIYLAKLEREAGFEKIMAIKRILPTLSDDAAFVSMFNREACIAAQLVHQNVVQIFDYGQNAGTYFIAMEYVHGRDLRALIEAASAAGRTVPPAVALSILSAACAALDYAHRYRGLDGAAVEIIHRDVSPQNILISYDGAVKLTDFGLAQRIDVDSVRDGQIQGKFAYMSPEQTFGDKLDRRTDIFSLGIVAYEMFCGHRPFLERDLPSLMMAIREGLYPPPSQVDPSLPQALDGVLAKALAVETADRYPDARAFQSALNDLARSQGWYAGPSEISEVLSTFCPDRSRGAAQELTGVGAKPSGGAIPSGTQAAAAPIAAGTQVSPRPIIAAGTQAAGTPIVSAGAASAGNALAGGASAPGDVGAEGIALDLALAQAETDPTGVAAVGLLNTDPGGMTGEVDRGALGGAPSPAAPVEAIGVGRTPLTRIAALAALVLVAGLVGGQLVTSNQPAAPSDWTLDMQAVPEGAEIFINNEKRGIAPLTVRNLRGDQAVDVRIVREGFKPYTRTIALTPGGGTIPVSVDMIPEPPMGTIILTVEPPEAYVKLDNIRVDADPRAPAGSFSLVRPSGEARLHVLLDGYVPHEQTIEVPIRSSLSMAVELKPRPMRVEVRGSRKATGKVSILGPGFQSDCNLPCKQLVNPPGKVQVKVDIDGQAESWTSTQSGGPGQRLVFIAPVKQEAREVEARFSAILAPAEGRPVGVFNASLEKQGQGVRTVELEDGRKVTLRYTYSPENRQITFVIGSTPYSAVSLNGASLGNTPLSRAIGPGTHTIYLTALSATMRLKFSQDGR